MTRPICALIVDDEPLVRERLETLLQAEGNIEVVESCGDGVAAVEAVARLQPDLLFLDVQMPEMDGFAVIKALEPAPLPTIVFITAYDNYALRAFEVHAVDYILKPIDPARFRTALARARERIGRRDATRFVVRLGSLVHFVRADDVDWIAAAGNYARLHAGGRRHVVRTTLKTLEARLDSDTFQRIHRSTIVNLNRVASIEPRFHGEYVVIMRDGTRLTSSRTLSPRLRARLR